MIFYKETCAENGYNTQTQTLIGIFVNRKVSA